MCLDSIDKNPKKHEIGYKLCRRRAGIFTGTIFMKKDYHLGRKYDAKICGGMPTVTGFDNLNYTAGFHYYLKMKDAKFMCTDSQVVIRIKVKDILATGSQTGYAAAVSRFMTLDRVVFDKQRDTLKLEKEQLKKFLTICKGSVQLKLLQFGKKFNLNLRLIKEKDMKEMADFLAKDIDDYAEFISFVDCFPRKSKMFQLFTKIHLWAYQNHKDYKKFYTYIVKHLDDPRFKKKLTRRYNTHSFMVDHAYNIDEIVLKKI